MSLLLRSFLSALGLLVIAGLTAIVSFNVVAAAVGWPGILIVNAVCAHFGIYLQEFPTWTWLIPSLLIDLVLYTLLFFACAKLWKALVSDKKQQAGTAAISPMTNDRRPTTQL